MWLFVGVIFLLLLVAVVSFNFRAPASASRAALGLERWRASLTSATVHVGKTRVSYLHGGRGDVLLLVHGFGGDKDNFTRVARHLTRQYRVVAVDLPGFGESSRLRRSGYSFQEQARRLKTIADALGLKRFHLGGSSMGGAIALHYADLYPEQVQSLWLLAPAGVEGSKDSPMAATYRATGRAELLVDHPADFKRLLSLVMAKKPWMPWCLRYTLGRRAMRDRGLHSRIFETIATGPGINAIAATLKVPALIVWGEQDNVLDVSGADLLHTLLVDSVLIKRRGAGHLPMIEEPWRCARDFKRFSRQLTPIQPDAATQPAT